ncbi:MAG: VWA domain-containing protein [Pyrinomonadaceae bacterium]
MALKLGSEVGISLNGVTKIDAVLASFRKQMFKIFLITLFGVFTFCSYAQSSNRSTAPAKKANARPTPTPESPKLLNDESSQAPNENVVVDDDVLKIETDLVSIPVRVVDRQGRFIGGMKKEEFSVFEDGTPQTIEYFSNEESPFTVALVLDMSYSTKFKIDEIQRAALTFVSLLRPNDKVMVVGFDGEVHLLSEPTGDRKTIEQAIISTRIGYGTSLYDALNFVLKRRLNAIKGRKAIVLFTDGVDTTSTVTDAGKSLDEVLEMDALIYPIHYDTYADVKAIEDGKIIINDPSTSTTPPIGGGQIPNGTNNPLPFPVPSISIGGRNNRRTTDRNGRVLNPNDPNYPNDPNNPNSNRRRDTSMPGSGTSEYDYRRAAEYLNELALSTGGRIYEANDNYSLSRAFAQIASELREFYSISYYPINEDTTKRVRSIKVKVAQKNVAVKARGSYVLGAQK